VCSDCKQNNYCWHKDHEVDTTRKQFGQASETTDQVAATATSVNAPSSARRLMSGVEIQAHRIPLAKQKTVSLTFIYII
jgi:hypothetical protein